MMRLLKKSLEMHHEKMWVYSKEYTMKRQMK